MGTLVFLDPVDQLQQVDGMSRKRLNLLSLGGNDASGDVFFLWTSRPQARSMRTSTFNTFMAVRIEAGATTE